MTPFDTLLDTLTARYSCRGYRPDPVPRATIEQIVAAAGRAPSWCNAQPWQVLITDKPETDRFRDALYTHATQNSAQPDLDWPKQYTGAYQDRRRTCGWQLYEAVGVEKGDRAASATQMMENFRLFGAPHVAIITSEADLGSYGVMDCGGFIANFLLAAQAHGVATIAQAALARHSVFLREYFGIGDDRVIVCGISFGYADEGHAANKFRLGRADVDHAMTLVTE